MQVKFQVWKSGIQSWETMFRNAANFASQLPKDRLINISHSSERGIGVVAVWYWDDDHDQPAGARTDR
jgi:hypothetical protein